MNLVPSSRKGYTEVQRVDTGQLIKSLLQKYPTLCLLGIVAIVFLVGILAKLTELRTRTVLPAIEATATEKSAVDELPPSPSPSVALEKKELPAHTKWDILGFRLGTKFQLENPGFSHTGVTQELICETSFATTHSLSSNDGDSVEIVTIEENEAEVITRIRRKATLPDGLIEVADAAIDKYGWPEEATYPVRQRNVECGRRCAESANLEWGDRDTIWMSLRIEKGTKFSSDKNEFSNVTELNIILEDRRALGNAEAKAHREKRSEIEACQLSRAPKVSVPKL